MHRQPQPNVVASIPEDPAAEAAEEEGSKAEALAAEKPVTSGWEADFSLEDAPTPPSKDVLTTSMGRKNRMVAGVGHFCTLRCHSLNAI